MTPVQRLQAAIGKLERLRDESGTFHQWNSGDFQDVSYENGTRLGAVGPVTIVMYAGSEQNPDGSWRNSSAIAMIQALHRTIDAQLAILRTALPGAVVYEGKIGINEPYIQHSLALADAILGSDQ